MNNKTKKFNLTIISMAFLQFSVLAYGIYAITDFVDQQKEQLNALHEIKSEISQAHLWLEEAIGGDPKVSRQKVLKHLDLSLWFTSSLLTGKELPPNQYIRPITDLELQQKLETIKQHLYSLKKAAITRLDNSQSSGIGTPIDQTYDASFEDFLSQVDEVEVRLWQVFQAEVEYFLVTEGVLLILTLILSLVIGLTFRRFENVRINNLQKAQQKIVKQLQELSALNNLGKKTNVELNNVDFANTVLAEISTIFNPDISVIYSIQGQDLLPLATKSVSTDLKDLIFGNHVIGKCLCGLSAQGKKVYSNNIWEDNRCSQHECMDAGIKSFVALPLKNGEKVIGVLGMAFKVQRDLAEFSTFMETLADQIAIGLQNCLLFEDKQIQTAKIEEQLQAISLSSDLGIALSSKLNIDDMLTKCCELFVHHLDTTVARIWLVNEENILVLRAEAGIYNNQMEKHRHKKLSSDNVIGNIALTKTPHLSNNLENDPYFTDKECGKHEKMTAFAGTPLVLNDKVLGVVAILSQKSIPPWMQYSLENAAEEIAVGVRRLISENALKQSQILHAEAQHIAHIGHWQLDLINTELLWSDELYTIFELDKNEYKPTLELFMDKIHPDDRDFVNKSYTDSVKNKTPYNVVHRLCFAGDRIKYIREICRTEYDGQGNPLRSLGTSQDITPQQTAEKEKKDLQDKLIQAQKMEAIGTLAGGIAHDFNNILTAIIGYTDLAKMDIDTPELLGNHIKEVRKAAHRATELVRQILTFSRKNVQEKQPMQIYLVIKEAIKLLRSSIPTTIEINQDISAPELVLADPTQIHQIVMNLCTNAYHAMRETGGTLSIVLKRVEISDDPDLARGPYLLFEVSDTGVGMDKETMTNIFEPYFTTKGLTDGTGLGLAVVYGVTKDSGGKIDVFSKPGKGTTFQIYLPIYEGEKAVAIQQQPDKQSAGGNETIMVVDDDPAIIDLSCKTLTRYGYRVDSFPDGLSAFQELERYPNKYDLILTDMTMPHMTGEELARKALVIRPELPIILCTGYSETITPAKANSMGIKKFCTKPLNMKNLLQNVRQVLNEHKIHGTQVLFVDDIQFNTDLGKILLERLGCKVTIASNGREALDIFTASRKFDIVITDQNMPNMTGIEMADILSTIDSDTPIILVTGDKDVLDKKQVQASGISEILAKPLHEPDIVNAICRVLQ